MTDSIVNECCPLCGHGLAVQDSEPEPNLYSEKLALLVDRDERELLRAHANWRCVNCGLLYKRRWFSDSTIRALFTGAVASHPKGWDAVLGRFSPSGFRRTVDQWADSLEVSADADVRRGQRELVSIIESIAQPSGFEPSHAIAAIAAGDVVGLRADESAIADSIGEPVQFRRFAGFRSNDLWAYLQLRTGGFDRYAEVGCPLWGLLSVAASAGISATFLSRGEPNYWGRGCVNSGERCTTRLLADSRIAAADWSDPARYPLIGLFQYLDHVSDPLGFLDELFARADSAAVILDDVEAPVAIQHLTGWTDKSLAWVAEQFGKQLHTDYSAIRPSGNALYLFTGGSSR